MTDIPIYEELTKSLLESKDADDHLVAIAKAVGMLEASMIRLTADVAAIKQAVPVVPKPQKGKKGKDK